MSRLSKWFFSFFVTVAAAAAAVVSCEEISAENTGITISGQSVSSDAGSCTVSVKASGRWVLSIVYDGDQDGWASLTTTSGRGSKDDILLAYTENTSEESRSLRVVLTVGNSDFIATFVQRKVKTPATGPGWLELPSIAESDGVEFHSHDMAQSGYSGRNYSFLYDSNHLVSHWVAYPLNPELIGSGDRKDDWGYDPDVPQEDQPVLFRGFSGSPGFDRGHQLPSADRLNKASNAQTFYFTNITPQLRNFNQGIWASFEGRVREWAASSDTMYVVTGCTLDNSIGTAYDNNGREVTVPGAYFKALLWYNSHSTYGSRYVAAGFYLEHRNYSQTALTQDMYMSIDELEELTGIDFFVNLPDKVGASTAAGIEAQDPADYGGLWGL